MKVMFKSTEIFTACEWTGNSEKDAEKFIKDNDLKVNLMLFCENDKSLFLGFVLILHDRPNGFNVKLNHWIIRNSSGYFVEVCSPYEFERKYKGVVE